MYLLLILQTLALGKILCLERVVTQAFTSQQSPVLSGRGILPRELNRPLPTVTVQLHRVSPQTTEIISSGSFSSKSNANRSTAAYQPVTVSLQRRRFFSWKVVPARMNRNQNPVTPVTTVRCSNSVPKEVNEVKLVEDPPSEVNSVHGASQNYSRPPMPLGPSGSTVNPVTGAVNVTVDDRSSFDGDQCPTGLVRVNGMCVKPD